VTTNPDWFQAVERDAQRYSVVFLQLGSAFAPYRDHFADVPAVPLTVQDYLEGHTNLGEECLVVLTDVHTCAKSRRFGLGSLRARVLEDIDMKRHKFVLVSCIARSAFPTVPGSDLLSDAKHVFASALAHAPGQVQLNTLPGWDGDDESKESFLAACVAELSAETVVNLGELIWDSGLSPNECMDSLTPLDTESLRGAGLVWVQADTVSWVVAGEWKAFRGAVAVASSRYMSTADWLGQTFVDLWLLERQLRNAVRDALMEKHGAGWREACVTGAMQTEVVERARKDVQPRAEQLKDLRDPLEWLTTSELLDLREVRQLGDLGLEAYLWSKLRAELLPIRNRAAHMRVVSERDARTTSTWRKLVMSKVGNK
jgi:hypothetical protein